ASIEGAHGVLLSIQGGSNLGIFEINDAARLVQEAVHPEANIIFGAVIDDTLGDEVRVTVIAAGFDGGEPPSRQIEPLKDAIMTTGGVMASTSEADSSASRANDDVVETPDAAPARKPWETPRAPEHIPAPSAVDPAFADEDELDIPDFLK
ncbi:FtsZ family, C-terminal domain, partial [Paramicrobacterium humi]